jgi:peptidoglycan/xylan/chitin deacetylase (PgdA/CDA1 family)
MLELPSHQRFAYTGIQGRPDFTWPGGKRLAVYIAVCVEHFNYGAGGLGLSYSPGLAHPNTYNWAWREYGNRVGGWRLAELAREAGVPLTVLLNASCYAHCPELVREMKGRDGEIVAHGLTNSTHPNGMGEEEERAMIEEVTRAIRANEGTAPAGWMSPGANPSACTEDLLQQAGYRYTLDWPMDDQPVWMRAGSGHLLSVPYPHEVNDVPMIALHHGTAPAFAQMAIDNFDELLRASRGQSLAYGITLHTFIAGQPFRLRQFRTVLEHMNARSDAVWFTTAGGIADHYASLFAPPAP